MNRKKVDHKAALLEAALAEFIEKSYEEASLNNIIKKAGTSKGTFYYHFQDKQALYLSLMQSVVDAKMEFLDRRLNEYSHNEDLNLFENLKLQARFGVEFAKDYPKYYLFGLMFLREKGKEVYDATMNSLGDITDNYYDNLLEKSINKDELRAGVSTQFAKKILPYLLVRYDEIFDLKEDTIDFDLILKQIDDLIDFIQYGLGK
ncbi:MAG: TetR/AcrR family transcriptional regulator [Bacillota bacterium]